ncbi:fungal-specific transcription factor domain-containing protein [Dactylonectria macrodidyma]|uniref:Fungal-specific transcription factor domain-containing protein n=1 Tax=Dactylonectria macrodidyma TaxID=307937 RepID=A0A9P9FKS7_9HYPO|nr:fungal-specific transcription factor domain-containing protein [Dactylonectria macrodidyma]
MERRSRNACWRCRERRVRCSLDKPTCRSCLRTNHRCQYGIKLTWREEALAKGICFGRQGVYGRMSEVHYSSRPSGCGIFRGDMFFLNTSVQDYDAVAGRAPLDNTADVAASTSTAPYHDWTATGDEEDNTEHLTLMLPPPILGDFSQVASAVGPLGVQLFEFFVTRICPNLSYSPTRNPYREFIIPLSLTSVPLFHAVTSWAANERSLKNGNASDDEGKRRFRTESIKHQIKALHGLREEIVLAQRDSSNGASILATIIMLSCNDICELCSDSWVAHLRAARVLCRIVWPTLQDRSNDFRRFCLMWFVSHDIMSRTAWIQDTLFEPSEWFAGDDETEIDPIISCSRGLIQQVSAVGALISDARAAAGGSCSSVSLAEVVQRNPIFRARRDAAELALQELQQRVTPCQDRDPTEQVKVAESKRLCSLIYLYSCLDGATPQTPVIQGLTSQVMKLFSELSTNASLTFPLFVAGTLGVWNEEDRRVVLDKFTELIRTRWMASVAKARDVVMQVWLERDLDKCRRWEDLVETKSRLLSLA